MWLYTGQLYRNYGFMGLWGLTGPRRGHDGQTHNDLDGVRGQTLYLSTSCISFDRSFAPVLLGTSFPSAHGESHLSGRVNFVCLIVFPVGRSTILAA